MADDNPDVDSFGTGGCVAAHRSRLVHILGAALPDLLGYANPFRCADRAARRACLRAEGRLAVPDAPLAVKLRRTYVNEPLGGRETTLHFQTRDGAAILACTTACADDAVLRCQHHTHGGQTYAVDVPWSDERDDRPTGGMFYAIPRVVEDATAAAYSADKDAELLLFAPTCVVRFGALSAAFLFHDHDAGHRVGRSATIGPSRHLRPLVPSAT